MQHYWYFRANGETQGPFPLAQLIQYVELGRLKPNDLVSPDGIHWKTVAQTEQFDAALAVYVQNHAPSPASDNEINWEHERALARVRWEDERMHEGLLPSDKGDTREKELESIVNLRRRHHETVALYQQAQAIRPKLRYALVTLGLVSSIAFLLWHAHQSASPIPSLVGQTNCAAPPAAAVAWQGCDKRSAKLAGVNLKGARLDRAHLDAADLRQADLSYANLNGASLRGANLSGALLIGADLKGADLTGADLSAAVLEYATLAGALMTGARLAGTRLGKAVWPDGRVCAPQSVDACA